MNARVRAWGDAETAEPFVGVHARGASPDVSFPIISTGASTTAITAAAGRFLDALAPSARDAARLELSSSEWRTWCNFHLEVFRHGAPMREMAGDDRERALDIVRATLSSAGFDEARDVMRLNETLAEVTGWPEDFGEWLYWMSIFGDPTPDGPWGFQLDGHHLNLSCVVLGDQIVMTPYFLGSEPTAAVSGKFAGTRVFEGEEADGFAVIAAMTDDERSHAVIGTEMPHELLTAAFHDNVEIGYDGVRYADLSPAVQERLVNLVARYVDRMNPAHAKVKMAEVAEHLDATYFCWIGGTGPEDVFYYRVQSPVILIEFDHLPGIVFENDHATRRHIHTVVRTPNGNDYGKNLLAQHYATHHRA